jgi:hypothetical protein
MHYEQLNSTDEIITIGITILHTTILYTINILRRILILRAALKFQSQILRLNFS